MTFIPIDLHSRKQTNKTYILLLKTFWSLILFCTGETSDRLETGPIQAIKMNNLSSNSTQAALRKVCQLSQYETWPSVDAESLGIQQIVFAVINAVMTLTAVFGNSLILAAVWKTPSLRSPSYVLISVLALSDLGVGIFIQPTYVITLSTKMTTLARINCISFKILGSFIHEWILTCHVSRTV